VFFRRVHQTQVRHLIILQPPPALVPAADTAAHTQLSRVHQAVWDQRTVMHAHPAQLLQLLHLLGAALPPTN
jgi:hypothetical protein